MALTLWSLQDHIITDRPNIILKKNIHKLKQEFCNKSNVFISICLQFFKMLTKYQHFYQLNTYCLFPISQIPYAGFSLRADFVPTRNGARALIMNGQKYVKDRETQETINWRCAGFIRFKCRSRAITKLCRNTGWEMVKLTNSMHTHELKKFEPKFEQQSWIVLIILGLNGL